MNKEICRHRWHFLEQRRRGRVYGGGSFQKSYTEYIFVCDKCGDLKYTDDKYEKERYFKDMEER